MTEEMLDVKSPLSEEIRSDFLQSLRIQNQKLEVIREQMNIAINGYIAGKGWSLEESSIEFNIDTGIVTVVSK